MRPAILLALVACSSGSESKPPPAGPMVKLVGCRLAPPPPSRSLPPQPEAGLAPGGEALGLRAGSGSGFGTIGHGSGGALGHGIDPALRARDLGGPHVRLGPPTISGALDANAIRRYMRRVQGKLSLCYQLALADKPELAGTTEAKFSIAGTGKVATAEVHGVDPHLEACVADVIQKIEFPKPTDGLAVQVVQEIAFKRAAEPAIPWTPYAAHASDDDPAARNRVEAEIDRMRSEIDACFGSAKGSLRAMIAPAQTVRVRAGGLGDPRVEDCVASVLRGIKIPPATTELACDFESGGPAPWRISPTGYERIAVTPPDDAPRIDASYLIVADRDASGDKIEAGASWASPAAIVAIAVTSDSGAPIFVGLAPSAALPAEDAPAVGLAAKGGVVATCDGKQPAKIADPRALDALFAALAPGTVAFALSPTVTAKELVGLSSAATRAGRRFRIGGVTCP